MPKVTLNLEALAVESFPTETRAQAPQMRGSQLCTVWDTCTNCHWDSCIC
ncbi:MAG TPA: hypothetical protein VHG91_00705 [Longimicrobium sp.]|nr:hypothetical protein [Longimicrobium sp.]